MKDGSQTLLIVLFCIGCLVVGILMGKHGCGSQSYMPKMRP
jgi:hypothetical protein